jgi:hypothetical protein
VTNFFDGPAAGVQLELKRAPKFLRAVVSVAPPGERTQKAVAVWDALDQLDDAPRDGETCHAYRLVADDGWMHLDYRDKKGRRRGVTIRNATYAHMDTQPDQDTMRDTEKWRQWCLAEMTRELQRGE